MTALAAPPTTAHPGMGRAEFIGLIAALMAVNALAIYSMLPALPPIAASLGLGASNQQQWIVTAYLLGFGAAQLVYGPLADRFGRKPLLLAGLAIYVVCSLGAAASTSFAVLIAVRVLQGIGAAATRVLTVSIVRDCYTGSAMAQVMSFSFVVFLAVPILAPSLGQLIMLVGPWPWVFGALALFGSVVMLWTALRLPETLHPGDRLPIAPGRIAAAFATALRNRIAVGYMLAMTLVLGALFGFINSAQQVFAITFGAPRLFTNVFALVATAMALSSLLNARVVERVGTRRVSHAALLAYIGFAFAHLGLAVAGVETLWLFALVQAGLMFGFGLVVSNFGALAMGPLGHLAGTGSSIQGFVTTVGGALLGFVVGQSFDGTAVPVATGFAGYGVLALAFVCLAERGRLFLHPVLPTAAAAHGADPH